MAKRRRIRWDRVILVFGPILLLMILILVRCGSKNEEQPAESSLSAEQPIVTTLDNVPVMEELVTTSTAPEEKKPDEIVIVIDPGHGGNDSGATNEDQTRLEKDDNLALGLAVRDAFEAYDDVRVIMTRETDVFVELQERCNIANNANADFFISLHRNSSLTGSGIEIWINNSSGGDNSWDKLLAEYIMDWLDKAGISKRRGIKQGFRNSSGNDGGDNYYVNLNTTMPSCLIEMGFMTSKEDNRNFDDRLTDYAKAIADGTIELLSDKMMYPPGIAATTSETTETTAAESTATMTVTEP